MSDNPAEVRQRQIGERWEADSSLEKWFPFTALELERLTARVNELEVSVDVLNEEDIKKGRIVKAQEARVRELEEAMPKPDLILAQAALMAEYGVKAAAKELLEAYDRIAKVMKK